MNGSKIPEVAIVELVVALWRGVVGSDLQQYEYCVCCACVRLKI